MVVAPLGIRRARLRTRDAIDDASADALLAAQLGDDVRRTHATHLIENDGDLASLRQKVVELDRHLRVPE